MKAYIKLTVAIGTSLVDNTGLNGGIVGLSKVWLFKRPRFFYTLYRYKKNDQKTFFVQFFSRFFNYLEFLFKVTRFTIEHKNPKKSKKCG